MSRGPGQIEQRIDELFAATRDHALSITDITDHAFALEGRQASRAQRLSATRAAHRLLRRVRDIDAKAAQFQDQARENTKAALGPEKAGDYGYREYDDRLKADPAWLEYEKLHAFCQRIGIWSRIVPIEGKPGWLRAETDHWCTALDNGRLYFHPPDVPVRVWAVSIQPAGVIWADAEVTKVTARNVMAYYAGELARLDRKQLWRYWAWWRGVRFVSSRTGRIAAELDQLWQERYGHAAGGAPPVMQMPLADAIALLGVPADYTEEDIKTAFRRAVKKAHPDHGGTAEDFRRLVEARDRLLTALGTSAPPPKMPAYYVSGTQIRYRTVRRAGSARLGQTRHLGHTRRLAR
jgi:hypothetical protein